MQDRLGRYPPTASHPPSSGDRVSSPVVDGRATGEILRHGPPPAFARGQGAAGRAEAWPQVAPGVVRGARAAAGL